MHLKKYLGGVDNRILAWRYSVGHRRWVLQKQWNVISRNTCQFANSRCALDFVSCLPLPCDAVHGVLCFTVNHWLHSWGVRIVCHNTLPVRLHHPGNHRQYPPCHLHPPICYVCACQPAMLGGLATNADAEREFSGAALRLLPLRCRHEGTDVNLAVIMWCLGLLQRNWLHWLLLAWPRHLSRLSRFVPLDWLVLLVSPFSILSHIWKIRWVATSCIDGFGWLRDSHYT